MYGADSFWPHETASGSNEASNVPKAQSANWVVPRTVSPCGSAILTPSFLAICSMLAFAACHRSAASSVTTVQPAVRCVRLMSSFFRPAADVHRLTSPNGFALLPELSSMRTHWMCCILLIKVVHFQTVKVDTARQPRQHWRSSVTGLWPRCPYIQALHCPEEHCIASSLVGVTSHTYPANA